MTPHSTRAKGLLALLGSAPALRRPRAWLQDKLWSDRSPENGSASLRQAVHRLREALGPERECLITERGWIGLDCTRVCVVLAPGPEDWEAMGEPPEFCQGLDIADPEFEDWLRDRRLAFEDQLGDCPPPPRPVVASRPTRRDQGGTFFVAAVDDEDRGVASLGQILSTQAGMAVGRIGGARVLLEEGGADPPSDAIRLAVTGCRLGDKVIVQAQLTDDGALLWSNRHAFPCGASGGGAGTAFESFVAEVTAAAIHHLGRGGTGPGASHVRAGYRALEDLFAIDKESLEKCERVFAATTEGPCATIHRAWRAQIRVLSVIERVASDPEQAGREAIEMISHSLAEDSHSSIVSSVAADVALLFEDSPQKAAHFARLAVERDPCSPYARVAKAQALAWLGRAPEAHSEALHALRLAAALPNQSFWLMRCCVTAVRCGRYMEAKCYAQLAHELAPNFKPPLRFLAALQYHAGDEALAAEALRRLKALEPDFSLELMGFKEYPATSIQNTPLIAITKSGLL